MVHKSDWESKQAQLDPSKYFKNTGSNVLENPRPDNDNDSAIVRLGPLNQQFQGVMQAYQGIAAVQGFVVNVTEIPPGQEAGTALGSLAKSQCVAELNTIGVDVLSEQGDLDDAVVDQRLNFREDISGSTVLLLAPEAWHDTKRAGVVTPHRDGHPPGIARIAFRGER